MVGEILGASEWGQLFQGDGMVLVRPFEQGQGQAVARHGSILVAAVLGEIFLEALDGQGIGLVVVGLAGAVEHQLGGLLGRHLLGGDRQAGGRERHQAEAENRDTDDTNTREASH
jgi:hypothetical protein